MSIAIQATHGNSGREKNKSKEEEKCRQSAAKFMSRLFGESRRSSLLKETAIAGREKDGKSEEVTLEFVN